MVYYTVAIISLLGAMYPGPDFVIVAKHALLQSRRNGIIASLGIGAGMLVHSAYCILGLALFISRSPAIIHFIKYLGASYFVMIVLKGFLKKKTMVLNMPVDQKKQHRQLAREAFRDGLITNVLNPSCMLFMLSLFTLVIKLDSPKLFQAINGFEIAFISMMWFVILTYALTLTMIRNKVEKIQVIVAKCISVMLLAFGIGLFVGVY